VNKPIVGRDAYGYMLDYYVGDYKPIGQQAFSLNTFTSPSPTPATGFKSLYNGNIGAMVTNIRQLNTAQYTYYHYDQLNRIKRMEALHGQNAAANTWTFGLRFNGYIESFTYDPNGNIKTLSRNSNVEQIDDLTYNYLAGTNKLTSVTDPIPSGLVNYDIDGQAANNYSYDRIGNMTADNAEGITNISWTVYGKIKNITKSNGTIEYRYDASGNRIYKKTVISGATTETYYARDAQGNVMAVYEKQAANPLKWMEQHLYGSSRLGMWNLADVVPGTTVPASGGTVEDGYLYGSKFFELSNHLGNVLVTVSDKKIGIDEGGNGTTDYFQPEVLTAQDYYSGGMSMPGRKYTKPNSGYRYGFNGKENDNDVKGDGNQQDYGMRIYDPRLGKFLSVDPLTKQYPWLSTYHYASNSPIANVDLDGLETQYAADGRVVFGPWAKDPVKGGWLYNTPKPSIFNYNEDHSKSNVTKSPASQPRTARQDNLQVSSQVLLAKQRAEKSLEPTSAKAYAEHMQKREHATVGPPDVRQGYTDFEWGMATSPATHWAIGMMLPGYNMTVATAMTYDGVRNGDYLQASLGVVGMAGGGLEYYGRSVASSPRMQLAQLESKTGGHFLSRHGSQTSLSSQYMRAISGLSPDGEVSSSVNSSRFFSDKLQLEAVNQANAQFAATGKSTFTFDMGKLIGEGYLKGGGAGSYRTTTQVQAVYKNGQLNTLYPLIK
jgi:RHS repeat-associated protein